MQANQKDNERLIARRILSIMLCSKRTLRWREVQAAICIDHVSQSIDLERRLSTHIREICGSLVEVLQGDRIEFVHITAALFVLPTRSAMED